MVAAGDFPTEITLELPQRHRRVLLGIVVSSFDRVAEDVPGKR